MTPADGPAVQGRTSTGAGLACVVLAHGDPAHLHRLIAALEPFPVFLHVDASTPSAVHAQMVHGLPERVRLLERRRTAWASWALVEVELDGYRAALELPGTTHVALLTGSDYPLASTGRVARFLDSRVGRTSMLLHRLPYPGWGPSGGIARLRYPHWVWRKRMLRLPVPRRIPGGLVLTGGSQMKVLAREHARAVLDAVAAHPALPAFWRRTWVPDETFVPTILSSPRLVPGFAAAHDNESLWYIGWDESRRTKSPPLVSFSDRDRVRESARGRWGFSPALFARKFSSAQDPAVLQWIDSEYRGASEALVTGREVGR